MVTEFSTALISALLCARVCEALTDAQVHTLVSESEQAWSDDRILQQYMQSFSKLEDGPAQDVIHDSKYIAARTQLDLELPQASTKVGTERFIDQVRAKALNLALFARDVAGVRKLAGVTSHHTLLWYGLQFL